MSFQSRYRAAFHFRPGRLFVIRRPSEIRFNLVIERLFISGMKRSLRTRSTTGFNLVIERLFISGTRPEVDSYFSTISVSISLSSGFSFQANADYVGYSFEQVSISLSSGFSFQDSDCRVGQTQFDVSISLSSGFSFQVPRTFWRTSTPRLCFNLVIERLLISGASCSRESIAARMFQSRYRAASHFRCASSLNIIVTFMCFNLVIERLLISGGLPVPGQVWTCLFQSRYRAASHFRGSNSAVGKLFNRVSISLSSGFSFQAQMQFMCI